MLMTSANLVAIFLPVLFAQASFVDPDYISSVDSVECNRIFPFAFNSPGTSTTLVDWDLQNFADNFQQFTDSNSNYAVTKESYVSVCYRDSVGLFCGVSYETERTFKWLRQITDAHPTAKAAIKTSALQIESAPSTSQLFQSTNDQRVYVSYESTDISVVVFVSFNYLSGAIEYVYRIHKGVNELANTMIMRHVFGAAIMDGVSPTSSTLAVVSLVMSYNSGKAFEIQLSNSGMKNPIPYRILDYQQKHSVSSVSAQGFKNNDFSKVLGISASSKAYLPNVGQTNVIQPFVNLYQNWYLEQATYTMHRKNSAYDYWVFSATAFLTQVSLGGNNYQNTVWWYVSRKFEDKQQIAELSYTFASVGGALTSYVVSPDAPQVCMTSEDGFGGSYIYIDEIARAAVKPQYLVKAYPQTCGSAACAYFDVDFTNSELSMGLKQYSVNKPVVCVGINTQIDTVSNTEGINDSTFTYFQSCRSYTTILLEQKNTGTLHLIQLHFRRSPTFNDQFYYNSYNIYGNNGFTHIDCISTILGNPTHDFFPGTTSSFRQYSYQINSPQSGYQVFNKGFVNFGIYMTWAPTLILGNEDPTSTQQLLSFYVASVKGRTIGFDTNNLNLRCQKLLSNSLDLLITDYGATGNEAINLSVQNPVYRYLNGAPYQSLTQTTGALTPLNYQVVQIKDATSLKSVADPTRDIDYDYSVCQRPKTFGLDPKVQKSLLCLQINTNNTNNQMNTQGSNLVGLGAAASSMDLNIWPYSNCWDRSTNPFYPNTLTSKPPKQVFSSYFSGWVVNSKSVRQADPTNTIKFVVDSGLSPTLNTDDSIQIQFLGVVPGTLGLQPETLKMVYKVGADAKNVTWDQKTMFQLSCQPADLVWQTIQDNRRFPIQVTYFFGQGPVKISLPRTIPTNQLTKYNIDQNQYLSFNYTVLFTSNTTGPTNSTLANVTIQNQEFIIDQVNGVEQWLMLGAVAMSIDPYYYVKNYTNGKVFQDWIVINLTQIVNVTFVYNVAPTFSEPLQGVTVAINDTVVVQLPEIFDPDSSLAYIQQVLIFPSAKFVVIQNTKQKLGSYITIKPTKNSLSGTYFCNIFLIDASVTPRQSSFGFQIKVLQAIQQPVFVPFIPKNSTAEISFKPDNRIGIQIDKVFTNQTVRLKFNLPMRFYINPLFTENSNYTTNVTKVLSQYLQLQHKQKDSYSQVVKPMKDPTFEVFSYDGLYLYLKLNFADASLLSLSVTESTDYIFFKFNQTQVFLSQNDLISTNTQWLLEFILPVQQSSTTQAIKAAAQQVSGSVTGFMTANFVINLLMSTSLQKMWGNLNVLQLVVATPLLQVNLPQNVFALCEALISVTQFQLFDSTTLTGKIFGEDNFSPVTLEPLNDRLNAGGYQQTNFIYNMGCMFYLCSAIIFLIFFALILQTFNRIWKQKVFTSVVQFMWRHLNPKLFTRLFFEINFELSICSYLQIKLLWSVKSGMDIFSSGLAILGALVCLFMPLISTIVINRLYNAKKLHSRRMKKYFGELYELQLVPRPTLYHLLYNVFFMLRRLTTLLCIFNMARVPSFQIGCMMWMTTFWMGYALSVQPYEDPALNVLEVVNELFYNLILLLCFTFTEFFHDAGTKTETGYVFIALLLTMLAINIGVQIKDTIKLVVLKLKRTWMLYQLRKQKWRSPLNFKHMPYALSHNVNVQHILRKQYHQRAINDVLGSLKTEVSNSKNKPVESHEGFDQKPNHLISVKLKPALKNNSKITHQALPNVNLNRSRNVDLITNDRTGINLSLELNDAPIFSQKPRQPVNQNAELRRKEIQKSKNIEKDVNFAIFQHGKPNNKAQNMVSEREEQKQMRPIQPKTNLTQPDAGLKVKVQNPIGNLIPGMTLLDYIQMQEQTENQNIQREQGFGRY